MNSMLAQIAKEFYVSLAKKLEYGCETSVEEKKNQWEIAAGAWK